MAQILPSIFGADILHLQDELRFLEKKQTKILHVDMMDGNYVSNIAFGPNQIHAMKQASKMLFDIHMMLAHPENHINAALATGAEMLSVHYESTPHIHWILQQIKKAGRKAGVVLNPGTPEEVIKYLIDEIDYVLIMSINPGRPGQSFLPLAINKIKAVKKIIGARPIQIEVDGGITPHYAAECKLAGADLLVVGGALFNGNSEMNYAQLTTAIK